MDIAEGAVFDLRRLVGKFVPAFQLSGQKL